MSACTGEHLIAASEKKKEVDNPFDIQKEDCDVVVKLEDHVMYLHESILSLYSPTFESMLNHERFKDGNQLKVLSLKEKKIEHLVELFKYFYPDKLQVTNEETNFLELLSLTHEFQVNWLTNHFEEFLVNTVSQDRLYLCSRNIRSLQLADRFNLKTLRKKLLSFKSYESFKELQKMEGFDHMNHSTMYELAKIRIRTQLENKADECNAIIKQLDEIFYDIESPCIIPSATKKTSTKEKVIENPFAKPSRNSDVVLKVDNCELHLHSAVLSLYSPVFKAMFDGNFKEGITKEVHLKGKEADYVIEMCKYLYANQFQKINAHTHFQELLSLCDEYQILWLTKHVEEHLVTKVFAKGYDDGKNIWGLQLADRFQLRELRSKLLNFTYSAYSKLQMYDGFTMLANATKYEIAKQRIKSIFPKVETQQYNIYSKSYVTRWVESEECSAVIQFLDQLFLHKIE